MTLILTRLQNMREKSPIDKHEIRASRYGALDTYMRQTESPTGIISEALKSAANISIGSTLEVPVIDDNTALTIGSTRDVVIVDAENTSRMIVIPFTTYAHGFTIVPSNFHNNEISIQKDFETKMKLTDRLFASAINESCLSHLEANKSKVFNDTLLYTELADTIVARYEQREEILGDSNVLMSANDFFGELHVVGSNGFESLVRKLAEKDLYNSVNKRFQYNDKVWAFDNTLPNGVGKYGTGYVIQEDSLGIMWRHEREAIYNRTMADGTEWAIDSLPFSMIPVSTYYYESRGDFSGITGAASADMTRVKKEHYGFAIDVALQAAYISDTDNRPTPIVKIQVNRSETDSDVTAPAVSGVTSSALTSFVLEFSEPVATDQSGTMITGDIKDLFVLTAATPAGIVIDSAIASADGLSVEFSVTDGSGNLAAADTIAVDTDKLYDGAGNVMVAGAGAQVNGGATAWVII